jgi:ATP-dependent RNA helicase DDX35
MISVLQRRPDLRVIVSSATLDAEEFKNFFNTNRSSDATKDDAAIISIEGRMHPIDIHYLEQPCKNYLDETISTVMAIHHKVARIIWRKESLY